MSTGEAEPRQDEDDLSIRRRKLQKECNSVLGQPYAIISCNRGRENVRGIGVPIADKATFDYE